ncbi:MAG: ExeA family protein [Cellvibrionaceae bacterium]
MYQKHFDLCDKPFRLIPDPKFLHFSYIHKLAYNMLEYGIQEQTGIVLITGEVGSGKTTLVRHLLNEIGDQSLTIGLINNTSENFGKLIQLVSLAFKLPYENKDDISLLQGIQNYLIEQYSKGNRCILIVDEAQNLSEKALEELRLLTNINSGSDLLLQIILVGQPQLFDLLSKPKLTQIAQRITVEYHLNPLSREETKKYINHRLLIAGARKPIFEDDAIDFIFNCSGGIPRLINTLCDYALVYAYATDKKTVDKTTTMESVKNRRIGGFNKRKSYVDSVDKVRNISTSNNSIENQPSIER